MLTKVVALSFAASALAQSISIVRPTPDSWWVADSKNTLQWTPCDTTTQGVIPSFNVVVMNSNQTLLSGNLTILGNEQTFECSKTITPSQLPPGTGYTLMLTNAINTLQVYTTSNFEVKAAGSTFPPQPNVASSSASGSGTASGSSPSQSGSGSGASALEVSMKGLFSMVLGVGALRALL